VNSVGPYAWVKELGGQKVIIFRCKFPTEEIMDARNSTFVPKRSPK